jgi:protein involved in polysaccharide export with SLBB domain
MYSVTVFSRRNDELQHSSYSTSKQSNKVSDDINLPAVDTLDVPYRDVGAPFSIINVSN